MTTVPKPVSLERDAATGVASIVFQRPEVLNAIDVTTAQAIRVAVEQMEAEHTAFLAATHIADFGEGVAAFLGKRAPVFHGH